MASPGTIGFTASRRRNLGILLFAFVVPALLYAIPSHSRTWYIDADGAGDAPTIQAGVDSAMAGDTVLVAPGTYTHSTEVLIEGEPKTVNVHLYKDIVVRGGGWPFDTVIDFTNNDYALFIEQTETAVFGGFEIYLTPDWVGNGPGRDAAICASGATIEENRFEYCLWGLALYITDGSANAKVVRRNIFYYNWASIGITGDNLIVENNTIFMAGNLAECGNGVSVWGDVVSSIVIRKNIILGANHPIDCYPDCDPGALTITCNCIDQCILDASSAVDIYPLDPSNILDVDPQFCGVLAKNVFLQSDSPCAPGNHPDGYDCGLIGALPVKCGEVPTEKSTWGSVKAKFGGRKSDNR